MLSSFDLRIYPNCSTALVQLAPSQAAITVLLVRAVGTSFVILRKDGVLRNWALWKNAAIAEHMYKQDHEMNWLQANV